MPKVSIIVPNYNHAKYLPHRLDSVTCQTFQDFELILLDDCSTDNSIEILTEYSVNPKVSHFVVNEKNSGNAFVQWNRGIKLATGKYVWIAESDDYCEITFLEEMVKVLEGNKNAGLAVCQSNVVNKDSSFLEKIDYGYNQYSFVNDIAIVKGKQFIIDKMLTFNGIPNASAVIFKKELIEKVGYTDETMSLCSDWLQWVNFLMISDIAIIDKYQNYFRKHIDTVRFSTSNGNYYTEYFRFLYKLGTRFKVIFSESKSYKKNINSLNGKIKDTIYKLNELKQISWRENIKKTFILLQFNFNFTNFILFIGSLYNGIRIKNHVHDIYIYRFKRKTIKKR